MAATQQIPVSVEAERSVVSAMLTRPKVIGQVVATQLASEHFHTRAFGVLFDAAVEAFYSESATDPISIVEACGGKLTTLLACDVDRAVEHVRGMTSHANPSEAVAHAAIVKRDHDRRSLLDLAQDIVAQVAQVEVPPEQIASVASERAMNVATSRLLTNEIVSYGDLGRRFVARQKEYMELYRSGAEVGFRFGVDCLDSRFHGLKRGELAIFGGEAGVGKSGIIFCAARMFAERQMAKMPDDRVGTFVLSLEMGEEPAADRFAQSEGYLDSSTLREGSTTDDELARIVEGWGDRKSLPMYFNFTSMLRASQLRAMIVEAKRKHKVGLVVIDHLRYFDADRRFDTAADEDEAKARFLKEQIAKELDVAVCVLAHTTKAIENTDDHRPRLTHLRGGGMVGAHADYVFFAYHPYKYASENDVLDGVVSRTEMELLWEKNRHGLMGTSYARFDASVMSLSDPVSI